MHFQSSRYLRSSQMFTRTEQLSRAAKAHSQRTSEDKIMLPSSSVSGSPLLPPRMSIPQGRAYLARGWGFVRTQDFQCSWARPSKGYTESGFPGYRTPRLNAVLRCNQISKSLELKQRRDGNNSGNQVLTKATVIDSHVRSGSGRMDTLKSKAGPSVKARTPFSSRTRISPHSEISVQDPSGKKQGEVDASEHKTQEAFEEENSEDLAAELSDLRKTEDSQMSNFNDEEEDEETLEMDSTVRLAKQIEVIINLKTQVDSSDCGSEKDAEQIISNEAQI
ncbi:uncharacterized protein LOC144504758 [Mustelus asterias]